MPYDKAFELADHEVAAHAIVFGEFEGQKYDWNAMRWISE